MNRRAGTQSNRLRIIGGSWRGRRLNFPDAPGLRPTSDRVRETLFNWLQETVPGENCLDLFAGSGACGLEALSRGAAHVTWVEKSRRVARAIEANLALLAADNAHVVCDDVRHWLQRGMETGWSRRFGLVFLDPPFSDSMLVPACHLLEDSDCLKPEAQMYLESERAVSPEELPPNWQISKERRAGAVWFYLCLRTL